MFCKSSASWESTIHVIIGQTSSPNKCTYRNECTASLVGDTSAIRADSPFEGSCLRERSEGNKGDEGGESHWNVVDEQENSLS